MANDIPARPAATVLLLRDGAAGLEVFMVVRHREIDFASGALVFPGGRVEPGDRAIAEGLNAAEADAGAFRVAAIRETFEECGVLLARPRGGTALIDAARLAGLEPARTALCNSQRSFAEILGAEALVPATDLLAHFAHWITPADRAKRFDTHFFLAPAPEDQLALHDGSEAVDSVWIRPKDALAGGAAGERKIVFPTRLNLEKLARQDSVAAAFAAARATPVVTVQPEMLQTPDGPAMRIPLAADYGGEIFPAVDPPSI